MPFDGIDPTDFEDLTVTSPAEWCKRAAVAFRTTKLRHVRQTWGIPGQTGCALAILRDADLIPMDEKDNPASVFKKRFGFEPGLVMTWNDADRLSLEELAQAFETYHALSPSYHDYRHDVYVWEPMDTFHLKI